MTANVENPQVSAQVAITPKRQGMVSSAVSHLVSRLVPYTPPWIGAASLPPLFGHFSHQMWGGDALTAGLVCGGMGTGGLALTVATWAMAGGNNKFRKFRRAQATASVAAGMGWLTCATAAGPFVHPFVDMWLLGGGLFATSWNVRQFLRNAHDETEQGEKGGFGKLAELVSLEKFSLKKLQGNGKGVVEAQVAVPAGHTIDEMQAAIPKLAAALQIPPNGVTVTRDSDDASRGSFKARVADLLKDGVDFIPPQQLGLLPTADIPVGMYADGEIVYINPFDADILQHLLVMGVTGAGKSEFCRAILAHLMTRRKMSTILVDLSKGRQTIGHIKDGLEWFITDKREAKHLFKALPSAIKARGDVLADEGLDQWSPKSKLNAVCVWAEEASDLVDFDELNQIARAARSVGIWLVISLQRATWTNISTDIRANLQATACFGVNEAADAGFCLPDRVTEAGGIPDWGADRPGYAYATGMGIPGERWTMEFRGCLTDRDYLAALVAAGAAYRDPLDDTTAKAFGLAYVNRSFKGTNRTNAQVKAFPRVALPEQIAPAQDVEDDDVDTELTAEQEESVAMQINDMYAEVMGNIPADPEPDAPYANLDIDDAFPEADDDSGITFAQPQKVTTAEALEILYGQLDEWAQAGRLDFEPADLGPATVAAGRKRAWLQGELKKLVERGVLRNDAHGEYTIVESPLVSA